MSDNEACVLIVIFCTMTISLKAFLGFIREMAEMQSPACNETEKPVGNEEWLS